MGFDPFSSITNSRHPTRTILLLIILMTLPCYCLGAVLLAVAPDDQRPGVQRTQATLGGVKATPFQTMTRTPFNTATRTPTGEPLQATPIQGNFPTSPPLPTFAPPPTIAPQPTVAIPTAAPTLTPTVIFIPTDTPTLIPTNTLAPTDPPPAPTEAPPTDPPTAIGEPLNFETPTQEGS